MRSTTKRPRQADQGKHMATILATTRILHDRTQQNQAARRHCSKNAKQRVGIYNPGLSEHKQVPNNQCDARRHIESISRPRRGPWGAKLLVNIHGFGAPKSFKKVLDSRHPRNPDSNQTQLNLKTENTAIPTTTHPAQTSKLTPTFS